MTKRRERLSTIREVIDQALKRGQGENRRLENIGAQRELRVGRERRVQTLKVIHDRRNGNYTHKEILPSHGQNPDLIKFVIACGGYSPARIARELKVSSAMVSQIIHGRARAADIEKYIERITNVSMRDLFPNWYREADN